ncbi:MAG TPA: gliding motility-associated ABC transporter permease subunit GldF [Lutibacter sp.]|nr:gliding motility-associated ABC transporter permease subunit GldF [Lutibacter sp.]
MIALFKKDFNAFFTSPIGYLVVGLFLLFNSLLLWFFKGDWNIFNTGFADMQAFFDSTPWLLLFLVPAITMRSFSDEYSNGTIEILKTRPLSNWQIVLGKFFATFTLILISLVPTLIYAFSISILAQPAHIDWGPIIGSYVGLSLLGAVFISIGLFTSILSKNQIVAFLVGLLLIFMLFYGIEQIVLWYPSLPNFMQNISLYTHLKSISKGVIDSRDLLYFLSVCLFFLFLTKWKLDK